jgi:hypothetical protein
MTHKIEHVNKAICGGFATRYTKKSCAFLQGFFVFAGSKN